MNIDLNRTNLGEKHEPKRTAVPGALSMTLSGQGGSLF